MQEKGRGFRIADVAEMYFYVIEQSECVGRVL